MSTRKTTTTTTVRSKAKPKKQPQRRKNPPVANNPTSAIYVAPCTRMYAKALTNPFAVQGLPCIPDSIVLPSYKFTTKARGVFSTGTTGVGFCIIDPFQMLVNDGTWDASGSPVEFGGAIYYTDKTYTLTNMTIMSAGVLSTGVNIANPNSMFSFADFNPGSGDVAVRSRQFRLVGCGLKVSYIGSNLYNAGRLVIFRNQGNSSLDPSTAYTGSMFLQDNYTSMSTVSRAPRYVFYVPDDPTFIAYNPGSDFLPNLGQIPQTSGSHYSMGIYIDGGSIDPNQQSWEFEAVAFFEAIGSTFTLSKSDGDPVGHDIIMSSLPNKAPTGTPQQVENTVMSNFLRGFTETTREVAYNVGRRAVGYAASAAVSYLNPSSRQLAIMPS